MPRPTVTRRSGPAPAIRPRRKQRKAVLTCPECGHQSPVDGDWVHRYHHGGVKIHCPTCETHLTTRDA